MLRICVDSSPSVADLPAELLLTAWRCGHRDEVLDRAVELTPREGLVCEFGVFEGLSTNYLARRLVGRRIFGFDSFQGLPEDWRPAFEAGTFSTGGRLPQVEPNVTLVPGWFENTLPRFAAEHLGPVALLHIDCDLYSSAKCVLDHLGDRVGPGTILVFDEFFNYPGWEEHEFRAFSEFVAERRLQHEIVAWNAAHEQVAIRITA